MVIRTPFAGAFPTEDAADWLDAAGGALLVDDGIWVVVWEGG